MNLEILLHPIELLEPAFGKAPEGFDPIDMDLSFEGELVLSVIDPEMFVIAHIHQSVIAGPSIGVDHTADIHLATDNSLQGLFPGIGNDLGINLSLTKKDSEDRLLASSASSFELSSKSTLSGGAEITLIQLHLSHELLKTFHLVIVDDLSEELVISVHGITIDP